MIHQFRSMWGMPQTPDLNTYLSTLKENGIHGIEASLSDIGYPTHEPFLQTLKAHSMVWICGVYSGWTDYIGAPDQKPVDEHIKQLKAELNAVAKCSVILKPVHLNIHSGSDMFSLDEALDYFSLAEPELQQSGISFSHETHRGRILYSPWVTLQLLKHPKCPDLAFTLDLSHWCVVAERCIDYDVLLPVLQRTKHIHARLGTPQSSQVSNPTRMDTSVREWFERCWREVVRLRSVNKDIVTMTAEYGPVGDGYMPRVKCGQGGEWEGEMDLDDLIFAESRRLLGVFGPE